jgi:hypothetical protein
MISATLNRLDTIAPHTKPITAAIVSHDALLRVSVQVLSSWGTTAAAENQVDIERTRARDRKISIRQRSFGFACTCFCSKLLSSGFIFVFSPYVNLILKKINKIQSTNLGDNL